MPRPGRDERERIAPKDRKALRAWLKKHSSHSAGVWVVVSRKREAKGLVYDALVEELLCFGWIDGHARRFDETRSQLLCTPRKPNGTWARSNKARVARLTAAGLMTPHGLEVVERAKQSGAWNKLDAVEAMVVPADLEKALAAAPKAREHFEAFPPSSKKQLLFWIQEAKRPQTRAKRIAETVRLAQQNVRAR